MGIMAKQPKGVDDGGMSARVRDIISVLCAGIAILFAIWSYVVWSSAVIRAAEVVEQSHAEHYSPDPQDTRDIRETYTPEMLATWERPEGPPRVGVQAGHWRVEEVPEELANLKRNGAGGVWHNFNERDVVLPIAREVVMLLEAEGIEVEVLPVTIPPGYVADAFVSLHADVNSSEQVGGFKVAPPRYDVSGRGDILAGALYQAYEAATGLPRDPAITWHMTGYYAFNWRRFEHAIHPMTPASIIELGYLSNARDRQMLLEEVDRIAGGVARGIQDFLELLE